MDSSVYAPGGTSAKTLKASRIGRYPVQRLQDKLQAASAHMADRLKGSPQKESWPVSQGLAWSAIFRQA